MVITILNGNPNETRPVFDNYIEQLSAKLQAASHTVHILTLRGMNIRYCTGCLSCWVKTPGRCAFEDDSAEVCKNVIHSDLMLFASPVLMGFISEVLKRAQDKMIPLIHPYIVLDQKECHHLKRYDKYPTLGLLMGFDGAVDSEDVDIITAMYRRLAINFKSRLAFALTTETPVEEVAHAAGSI